MEVLDRDGLDDNYCALALSILLGWTPERAFDYLCDGAIDGRWTNRTITEQDIMEMAKMKSNMTYPEIGHLYGLSGNAVYRRITRYKAKEGI